MEFIPIRVSDIIRQVNRDIYLPAIQRELVWGTDRIERLFDSIMADFPIGSFLFCLLQQENKDQWPVSLRHLRRARNCALTQDPVLWKPEKVFRQCKEPYDRQH